VDSLSYKTLSVSKTSVDKDWYIIDAESMILGRLATKIATVIRGKHKPSFTPHVDCGDNVIVINADKIRLTGNKWNDKEYVYHTGYPGGQRFLSPRQMMQKGGHRMVEKAIKGMLPKNKLGRQMFKNLYVYAGTEHPHEAQQPKDLKF
jgi:large subunit ribosomal protein L13